MLIDTVSHQQSTTEFTRNVKSREDRSTEAVVSFRTLKYWPKERIQRSYIGTMLPIVPSVSVYTSVNWLMSASPVVPEISLTAITVPPER